MPCPDLANTRQPNCCCVCLSHLCGNCAPIYATLQGAYRMSDLRLASPETFPVMMSIKLPSTGSSPAVRQQIDTVAAQISMLLSTSAGRMFNIPPVLTFVFTEHAQLGSGGPATVKLMLDFPHRFDIADPGFMMRLVGPVTSVIEQAAGAADDWMLTPSQLGGDTIFFRLRFLWAAAKTQGLIR